MSEDDYHHAPGEDQHELDAVEICDNGEPLVDFLAHCPRLVLAPQHPVFEFPRVHLLRETVARKLCEAAHNLPTHLTFHIVEGYRPIAVQRAMFDHAMQEATKRFPDWDDDKLRIEAGRYSAPPDAITGTLTASEIFLVKSISNPFFVPSAFIEVNKISPAPSATPCFAHLTAFNSVTIFPPLI